MTTGGAVVVVAVSVVDLAAVVDLAVVVDLGAFFDLAAVVDLAAAFDLASGVDFAAVFDLAFLAAAFLAPFGVFPFLGMISRVALRAVPIQTTVCRRCLRGRPLQRAMPKE